MPQDTVSLLSCSDEILLNIFHRIPPNDLPCVALAHPRFTGAAREVMYGRLSLCNGMIIEGTHNTTIVCGTAKLLLLDCTLRESAGLAALVKYVDTNTFGFTSALANSLLSKLVRCHTIYMPIPACVASSIRAMRISTSYIVYLGMIQPHIETFKLENMSEWEGGADHHLNRRGTSPVKRLEITGRLPRISILTEILSWPRVLKTLAIDGLGRNRTLPSQRLFTTILRGHENTLEELRIVNIWPATRNSMQTDFNLLRRFTRLKKIAVPIQFIANCSVDKRVDYGIYSKIRTHSLSRMLPQCLESLDVKLYVHDFYWAPGNRRRYDVTYEKFICEDVAGWLVKLALAKATVFSQLREIAICPQLWSAPGLFFKKSVGVEITVMRIQKACEDQGITLKILAPGEHL